MREWADEERLEAIASALRAPTRIDPVTKRPAWYGSDDDVWAEWQAAAR